MLAPNGTYEIRFTIKRAEHVTLLATSLVDWHQRLGHASMDTIKHMADQNIVDGLFISDREKSKCETCALSKSQRSSHPSRSTPRAKKPGQFLHFDTVGPMPENSLGGMAYFVLCKDSFSSYRKVFFVSLKSDIPDQVKKVLSQSILETGNEVLQIASDNGTEFKNNNLKAFLDQHGINHVCSSTYTPEQNGYIERDIRTVSESAKTLRLQAGLPKPFWAEAVNTAVYLLNRVINTSSRDKTPFENWFDRKPSLNNLHRFGDLHRAIVHAKDRHRDKLDPKGDRLVFVGYTEIFNTFRFIHLPTSELFISCDAVFLEQKHSELPTVNKELDSDDTVTFVHSVGDCLPGTSFKDTSPCSEKQEIPVENVNEDDSEVEQTISNLIESILDAELDQTMQTHSSNPRNSSPQNASMDEIYFIENNIYEVPADCLSPEEPNPERMASLRPRTNKPNYMGWKLNLGTIESASDPLTFQEAMNRSDKQKWLIAMQDEMDSLAKNKVWILVDRPHGKNIVTCRWVYTIKRAPNGDILRYRARLVARGFSQVHGVDYFETYAPVANMSLVRMLFAYAAIENLCIAQFDIKTAFLYGDLPEEVYMQQPSGFETDKQKVCYLKKSLYGLKQAPRQWNAKFTQFLLELKLQVSEHDKCVFFSLNPFIILAIYVDDGVIFAKDQNNINEIMSQLKQRFEVHTIELSTFLGFQITRPSDHQVFLHQTSYVNKVVTKFNMATATPERSPVSMSAGSSDVSKLDISVPYRECIGSLLYASVTTRVDIAFAVGKASRKVADPLVQDWCSVKRILRYLVGEKELGLCYNLDKNKGIVAYCDADFAGDVETRRSTTGSIILLAGAPIHWRSSRQGHITTSSTEAEYISLCSTTKDVIWLRKLAIELGIISSKHPTVIYCDNESAIRLAKNEKSFHRTKHLEVQANYCREKIESGQILIKHTKSQNQIADMLTKATTIKGFIDNRDKVMVNRKSLSLFIAMLSSAIVLSLLNPGECYNFDTVRPIIYQPTDKFIDMGVAEYVIDYTYTNPCNILNNYLTPQPVTFNGVPNVQSTTNQIPYAPNDQYIKYFIDECNSIYQKSWIFKVNELLARGPTAIVDPATRHIRSVHTKRGILSDVIFGTVVSNFLSTIFEPLLPWSDYHRINEIREMQTHEAQRIQKFQHELNITHAVQIGMLELIKNNTRSIREQNRQLAHLVQLSGELTWLSSLIHTRLLLASSDLRTIIDEYVIHRRVAVLELSEMLNITELRSTDNLDTEFISVTSVAPSTLRFKFNIRLRSKDTFIYRIHAFRYWDNLTGQPNFREFQGDKFVVYNTSSNCIKGIEEPTERAVIDECVIQDYSDPKISIWRTLVTTKNIYAQHNTSAVKRTMLYNYVYCFPWNITIQDGIHRCPIQVFRVPIDVGFKTVDHSYTPVHRKMLLTQNDRAFIDTVHISHFDDNSVAATGVILFDKVQDLLKKEEVDQLEKERSVIIEKNSFTWWLTILGLGFLVICSSGLVIYNLLLTKRSHKSNKVVAKDIQEMKRTYESTSCVNCQQSAATQNVVSLDAEKKSSVEVGRDESITINLHRPLPALP